MSQRFKLEARAEPVYHSIWGKDADELTLAPFTQNSGHPLSKGRIYLCLAPKLGFEHEADSSSKRNAL